MSVVSCLYIFFSWCWQPQEAQSYPRHCQWEMGSICLMWDEILSLLHTSRSYFCFPWWKADPKPLADTLGKGGFLTALPSLLPIFLNKFLVNPEMPQLGFSRSFSFAEQPNLGYSHRRGATSLWPLFCRKEQRNLLPNSALLQLIFI